MAVIPLSILDFARRHHGLVTTEALTIASVSPYRRQRLVREGVLVPVHSGVDRLASHPATFLQHCLAACLADERVVISGPSCGRLYELRRMPEGPVHAMTFKAKVELSDVVLHRTTVLGKYDIVARDDGIRLLKPARLVPDLARFLDDVDLESVIEQMLDRRMTSVPTLLASARRLRAPGRDGTVRLGRVLDRRPAWLKPKDSHLEVRLLRALADRGVALVPQYRLDLGHELEIHFDGADPEVRLGVEIDHVTWHGGRLATIRDKQRDRKAARIGWCTVRVTDDDLAARFDETVDDIVTIWTDRSRSRSA